jgi:hypothetical protein
MARKKVASVLAHKKAAVGLHRNGLSIDVQDVPAEDVGLVAKELLDVLRTLQAAGYDELTMDAGSLHSSGHDQTEEPDGEEWVEPAHAARDRPRLGFTG